MDSKYNNSQHGVDHHSYLCERKQRVSIKDRGDLFIKNIETQVLELYRCNVNKQQLQESSSNTDDQIQATMQQVANVDKQIEKEILKLRNFRYCFLNELERKNTKRKPATMQATNKNLTWSQNLSKKHAPISSAESPDRARRQQALHCPQNLTGKDDEFSIDKRRQNLKANSNFSTIDTVEEEPRIVKKLPNVNDVAYQGLHQPAVQDETSRLTGGSAYERCDDLSVYQLDYPPSSNETNRTQIGYCQGCNRYFCYYNKPITRPPNPWSYQYPLEPIYQHMSYNESPQPSYEKRKTDLNTEQFCRGSPLAILSRAPTPRQQKGPIEKSKPKYPTSHQKSQKQDTPPKVSVRKQEADKSDAQRWAKSKIKKDKMIIKAYVAATKSPINNDYMDLDTKLRLHREYLNMYKEEEQKTARKGSSRNTFGIETNPTYTRLPMIKVEATEEKQDSALEETVQDAKAAPVSDPPQETGVEKSSVPQMTKLQTRNKINESASDDQTNEVVEEIFTQSTVADDKNISVEHSLREYCRQLPATDTQAGQTFSHQSITPAQFVSDGNSPIETTRKQITIEAQVDDTPGDWQTTGSLQVTPENLQHDLERGNTVPQFTQQHDFALNSVQQTSINQEEAFQAPEWLQIEPDEYRNCLQQNSAPTHNQLSELQDCQEVMQSQPQADIAVVSFNYAPDSSVNKADSSSGCHLARIDNRCQVVESTDDIYDTCNGKFKSQFNNCREYPVERGQNYNNTELGNTRIDHDYFMESQSKISPQVHNPLSVSEQTEQRTTNLELYTKFQHFIGRSTKQLPFNYTYESQWKQRIKPKQLAINSQQTPIKSTHLVTFKDEIGFSEKNNAVTSYVDQEQVTDFDSGLRADSAEMGTILQQIAEDVSLTESYLSNSSAEFTCNESKFEEDILTCNESQTDMEDNQIPPFSCCPCMYEDYLKLAGQG
ncbi:uncharacterized protein LOC6558525 [Drosophila grimshawi]|uniref:GH16667 n=1 Tax=Drosophila grimshawi TaxID=7222 RepID=B4J2X1_DROGR|nr:uncharacterized protein LOC6558525 [Drosophila grimshawi]EDV97141.1 GH16667 [Drosophila grimshawi]